MMNTGDIKIERAECGFIVYEDAGTGLMGKKWAFEDHEKLAQFVIEWCEEPKPNPAGAAIGLRQKSD